MASFFAKARERAEAAAQQLQAHHAASSANKTSSDASASGDATGSGTSSSSGFTYTGSVPHLFRQGLASVDPRYESTRQFHLLSQAIKGFNIDHEAAGREAKSLAKATFVWGQHHLPEKRHDGVGDEMLTDVTDRLAYVWHEIGQLETAHSQRSEQARSRLKRFEKAEMELGQRRANRNKLKKELHDLVPERAIAAGSARAQEAQSRLQDLIDDDQADEESLSRLKRESVKEGYTAMFDSLIELGEKMALVARYGKLLTTLVPTEKSPFPASAKPRGDNIPLWDGASKTADVRAALASALSSFQPDLSLPTLSTNSSLGRADTVSYGVSHKAELQDNQDAAAAVASPVVAPAAEPLSPRRPSVSSERSDLLQPVSAVSQPSGSGSGNGSAPKLNLSPTALPAPLLPPRPQRSPSATASDTLRSPTANPFADSAATTAAAAGSTAVQDEETHSPPGPPGPTVAETGVVPTGPGGPKSGTLRPRRSSASQRSASISAAAVAYLGPTGTYSHQAALKVFGEAGTNLIPMQSITGAIDFVRRGTPGNAKIAIVPVENSTFGPVRDTLDNLLGIANGDRHAFKPADGAQLHVVGEACLSVDHALLCGPKTYHHLLQLQGDTDPNAPIRDDTLSNITNVISHEQALGQCSHYLTRYLPQAQKKAVESTAAAAVTALEFEAGTAPGRSSTSADHALGFSSNSLVAAVGAAAAATTVGVRVLRSRIQDVQDNRTRFLVLASEPLQALLAINALPQSLSRLYSPSTPAAAKTGRSLLGVNDALASDLAAEAGSYSRHDGAFDRLTTQLHKLEGVSVRKVDRRPASSTNATATDSSVWRSSYLFELQYPASSAAVAEAQTRQVVAELSLGSSASTTLGDAAPITYLGSWLVDGQTLRGETTSSAAGQAPNVSPAAGASGSSLSQIPLPASSQSTDREKKELEAQQEAAEVQRHAAQARFSRQQQQAELYGTAAQPSGSSTGAAGGGRTQPLSGLQESEAEQRLDDEEGLPAYQPLDPGSRS